MVDPMGIFLLAVGVVGAIWPYKFAKFGEQLDSVGSKRSWYSVEPADWNVTLTRIVGISMSLVGVLTLVANL